MAKANGINQMQLRLKLSMSVPSPWQMVESSLNLSISPLIKNGKKHTSEIMSEKAIVLPATIIAFYFAGDGNLSPPSTILAARDK